MMATDQSLQTLAAQVQGLMLRCRLIWMIFSLSPSLHIQQTQLCVRPIQKDGLDSVTSALYLYWFNKLCDVRSTENLFKFLWLIQVLLTDLN